MQPTSASAFADILKKENERLSHIVSSATWLTIWRIHMESDPETWEEEEYAGQFLEDVIWLCEKNSTVEGSRNFIQDRLNDCSFLESEYHIGEGLEYPDEKSFLSEVDHKAVVYVIKKCWDKACEPNTQNEISDKAYLFSHFSHTALEALFSTNPELFKFEASDVSKVLLEKNQDSFISMIESMNKKDLSLIKEYSFLCADIFLKDFLNGVEEIQKIVVNKEYPHNQLSTRTDQFIHFSFYALEDLFKQSPELLEYQAADVIPLLYRSKQEEFIQNIKALTESDLIEINQYASTSKDDYLKRFLNDVPLIKQSLEEMDNLPRGEKQ